MVTQGSAISCCDQQLLYALQVRDTWVRDALSMGCIVQRTQLPRRKLASDVPDKKVQALHILFAILVDFHDGDEQCVRACVHVCF